MQFARWAEHHCATCGGRFVVNRPVSCCPACAASLVPVATDEERRGSDRDAYHCGGCSSEWSSRERCYSCPVCACPWPAGEPLADRQARLAAEFGAELEQAFRELGPPI